MVRGPSYQQVLHRQWPGQVHTALVLVYVRSSIPGAPWGWAAAIGYVLGSRHLWITGLKDYVCWALKGLEMSPSTYYPLIRTRDKDYP